MTLKTITIAALLLGTSLTSGALTLGRVRGAAWIGQPLDITVAVQLDGAASATPLCAEADVFHADSRQDAAKVRVSTAPTAQADTVNLRVQSSALIDEPVVTVYLRAGCTTKTSRRYVLLADFPSEASAPLTRFVAPAVPTVPTIVVPQAPALAPAPQAIAATAPAPSAEVAPPAAAVAPLAKAAPAPLASALPAPAPAPAPVAVPAPTPAAEPAQPGLGAAVSGTVTQAAAEKGTAPAAPAGNAPQNSPAKPVTKPAQSTQALALAPPASPAKPVQAAPAKPRPTEPKAAAPIPRIPKPVEPAASQGAGKPRLQLDPLDNLNERIRNLEAGAPASAASDSERARMDQLQASVKALLDQSIKSEANLIALRQRLEQAESERVPVGVVYALGALVVLCLGAVAYLWTRRKTSSPWEASENEPTA